MSDLIYLAIIVGFFAAAVGLLRACEAIIGPDAPASTTGSTTATATGQPAEQTEVAS